MLQHKIVAPRFSYTHVSRNYLDISFFIATILFLLSLSTLSRQDSFDFLTISILIDFSFVATDFSSLVLVAG